MIEIVGVVTYLGLDVEKENAVVDLKLNVPFDRSVYDAERDLVGVVELIVAICDANELLALVNIDGELRR